jgi:hypothetical protein
LSWFLVAVIGKGQLKKSPSEGETEVTVNSEEEIFQTSVPISSKNSAHMTRLKPRQIGRESNGKDMANSIFINCFIQDDFPNCSCAHLSIPLRSLQNIQRTQTIFPPFF